MPLQLSDSIQILRFVKREEMIQWIWYALSEAEVFDRAARQLVPGKKIPLYYDDLAV